jgi:hypothetical protein
MRRRWDTIDRDMAEVIQQAGAMQQSPAEKLRGWLSHYGFAHIQFLQYNAVDLPVWIASYEQALKDGLSMQDAAAMADRLLIESQGSGVLTERSAIERGRVSFDPRSEGGQDTWRLLSIMGSYLFSKWNLAMTASSRYRRDGAVRGAPRFMGSIIALFIAEQALQQMWRRLLSDDDELDDELLEDLGVTWLTDAVATVPVVGPIASSALQGFDSKGTVNRVIDDFLSAAKEAYKLSEEPADRRTAQVGITLTGDLFGIPATVMNRALKALFDQHLRLKDEPATEMLQTQLGGRVR